MLLRTVSSLGVLVNLVVLAAIPVAVWAQEDLFHYGMENREWEEGTDYGMRNWDQVECDDIDDCVRLFVLKDSIKAAAL